MVLADNLVFAGREHFRQEENLRQSTWHGPGLGAFTVLGVFGRVPHSNGVMTTEMLRYRRIGYHAE